MTDEAVQTLLDGFVHSVTSAVPVVAVWVDLGLITYARASVTLGDGRLITKRAALELLPSLGAPPAVVRDVHARRYGDHQRPSLPWRIRRGELTRTYLHAHIPTLAN